jgi:hypothetical protein
VAVPDPELGLVVGVRFRAWPIELLVVPAGGLVPTVTPHVGPAGKALVVGRVFIDDAAAKSDQTQLGGPEQRVHGQAEHERQGVRRLADGADNTWRLRP